MLGDGYFFALALGAGMIGQDVSSGTLPLLLARPVSRAEYVFSRWGAISAGAFSALLLQALTATAIMLLRGASVPWGDAGLFLADGALLVISTAALLALLSSLAGGLGDIGLLVLLFLSAQVVQKVAMFKSWMWLVRGTEELVHVLKPELNLGPLAHGAAVPWFAVVSWLSTVTLCLALAIVVMNRRELSYASSGS
jgi:ABC-type transport system involved in multi-copper enzyme maturation permease subunit